MDQYKLTLLIHTLRYLRFKQIYYRLYYFIRNKAFKKNYKKTLTQAVTPLNWDHHLPYKNSFKKGHTFSFLNLSHHFKKGIDWNYQGHGKLWAYNLNYFDFLMQEDMAAEDGISLIKDYILKDDTLKDGKEPYPLSLRGINWIKFLSVNKIEDKEVHQSLYNHYQILRHSLEYHLLGNHLLENAFSLFFGAYYFKDDSLYKKAKRILEAELNEQILNDGGHFELSPMYHQIILHRLLDCIQLIRQNTWKQDRLEALLQEKALKMLSWLQAVTYRNGNIPMVNDSAYDIAMTSEQLFAYASQAGLSWGKAKLSDSGYRKFEHGAYELFTDTGKVGPEYQPGHAHADTFSFELYKNGSPVIVDSGVSTYEKEELRQQQRGTAMHNTVTIGDRDQSRVWGKFRVAQRAQVRIIRENERGIEASHNGYKNIGATHTRQFTMGKEGIRIRDVISGRLTKKQMACLHFHPRIKKLEIKDREIRLTDDKISIKLGESAYKIQKEQYYYCLGFNKTAKAEKVNIYFNEALLTEIC